jgi:hypothetical protein
MRDKFLDILLDFTHNDIVSVRNNAIHIAKNLHEKDEFKQSIEVQTCARTHTNERLSFSSCLTATRIDVLETFDGRSTARGVVRRREENNEK